MKVPEYEIFKGELDKDAMWLEAVEIIGEACDRMVKRAAKSPGKYFVLSQRSHDVLATIDTSKIPSRNLVQL
jgi:hypothetical protein